MKSFEKALPHSLCKIVLVTSALVTPGCFGATSPGLAQANGDITPQTQCIQLADPAGGATSGTIGQTETGRFEPVFPLQDVYLVFGAQGGHHIDISLQFYSETLGRWRHEVRLVDSTNEEIVGTGEAVVDVCPSGWSQTDYIRIHLNPTGWVNCRIEISSTPLESVANDRYLDSVDVRVRSPQT